MPSNDSDHIVISGIQVQVNRKNIKNLHLSVLPPNGRVRLSVPHTTSEQAIRLAIITKLAWIKKQQTDFAAQPRQSSREMVSGESHYLWGQRYRLSIVEASSKHAVTIKGNTKLEIAVASTTTIDNRLKLLNDFYRKRMQDSLVKLLPYWQQKLDVQSSSVCIKKMKTKWGSCNIQAKRLWLNLELAKKPPDSTAIASGKFSKYLINEYPIGTVSFGTPNFIVILSFDNIKTLAENSQS